MFDDASAGSLQLYAAIVFVTYAGGCGFISRATGCKIAACYAGIAYLALRFLGSFDVTSDVAAQLVRLLAFQTYLALFCSMLYGRDAMTFLTNWCLWFHCRRPRRGPRRRPPPPRGSTPGSSSPSGVASAVPSTIRLCQDADDQQRRKLFHLSTSPPNLKAS